MNFAFYLSGELGCGWRLTFGDHTEDPKGCQSQGEMSYI